MRRIRVSLAFLAKIKIIFLKFFDRAHDRFEAPDDSNDSFVECYVQMEI